MFGFVAANINQLSEAEKKRYQSIYCGLCRSLKTRHGLRAQLCLSYDFTFYVLLCNSLHEPLEDTNLRRCPGHAFAKRDCTHSNFSDLGADLSVLLAYYKCLDDVSDESSTTAQLARRLLQNAYLEIAKSMPELNSFVGNTLEAMALAETCDTTTADQMACAFGNILGAVFSYKQGFWSETMGQLGYKLGQFIYLMDSAVDLQEDKKRGQFNPLISYDMSPEELRQLLEDYIGDAMKEFEKLPLEHDLHLMRSILYSGVWQQFNHTYGDNSNIKSNNNVLADGD